jgi:hypothetical protein
MEFYFHYLDKPATLAGLETKYTFNTTQAFRFINQKTAYQNSFYKPIGLPKISASFYMYPSFLAPVTVDGDWRVSPSSSRRSLRQGQFSGTLGS